METYKGQTAEVVAVTFYNDSNVGGQVGITIYFLDPNSGQLREVDAAGEGGLNDWWGQLSRHLSFVPGRWYMKPGSAQETKLVIAAPGRDPLVADPEGRFLARHHIANHVEFQKPYPDLALTPDVMQLSRRTVQPEGTSAP